jgi:hypothetical protein
MRIKITIQCVVESFDMVNIINNLKNQLQNLRNMSYGNPIAYIEEPRIVKVEEIILTEKE